MNKQTWWESITVILAAFSLWPFLYWHNQEQTVPTYYWFVLASVVALMSVILVQRIRQLHKGMRDTRNR